MRIKALFYLFLFLVLSTSCVYAQEEPQPQQNLSEWVFGEVVAKEDLSISIEYLDFDLDDYRVMVLNIDNEKYAIYDDIDIGDMVSISFTRKNDGSLKVEQIRSESVTVVGSQ